MIERGRRWLPAWPRMRMGPATDTGIGALSAMLGDRHRYERQIDRLHQRHLGDGGLWLITEGDVSLGSVVLQRSKVARMLAKAVAGGDYRIKPARLKVVHVDGKARTVFRYDLLDLIVHGVVAEILAEAILPTLPPNLYSYKVGVSWLDGVGAFAAYTRAHHRAHADPKQRGLYVLRRDVAAYTDSIPVGPESAIWAQIGDALGLDASDTDELGGAWQVVRDVVRAQVREADGSARVLEVGVPTGQPVASVAFNLYLRDMDIELAQVPGAFYGRYSDDLLFAHPDPEVVRSTSTRIEKAVHAYELKLKDAKSRDLYLTGAGRSSTAWPESQGTRAVTFVGMDVALDGTVALGGKKMKRFLREVRRRARNAALATAGADGDARGRAVVAAVNGLLDPDDAALQGAPARLFALAVTDRGQLEWLDHELALIVASTVSGERGSRAFRWIPYRLIREDWGLHSTRRARDRATRPRGSGTRAAA